MDEPKRAVDPNKKQFPSREQMNSADQLSVALKKALSDNKEAKQAVQNFIEANDPEFQAKAQKDREALRLWIIAGVVTTALVSLAVWLMCRKKKKT